MQTWKNIDLLKLAGIGSIVGIDISETFVHVVEIKRKGSLFNKYSGQFVASKSVKSEHSSSLTSEEKSQFIRDLLSKYKITSRYAVSTFQGAGAKTIKASLPRATTNIEEWIRENYERLLKLHVPIDQLSFGYEIIDQTESGLLIEINFVRNSELGEFKSLLESAGLELLSLGVGTRDAVSALIVSIPNITDAKFVYIGHKSATSTTLSQRKRVNVEELNGAALRGDLSNEIKSSAERIILSGHADERPSFGYEVLKPLGLPSEFTLAVGLAVKGFLRELSPVNLLSFFERRLSLERVLKSVTKRVVLTLGSAIIVIVGIEAILSAVLTARISDLDEKIQLNISGVSNLHSIEREIATLEGSLTGVGGSLKRSHYAKILHDLASAAPESVWLSKLSVRENEGTTQTSLHGFSSSDDFIARYLKNLDRLPGVRDVQLVSSGGPSGGTNLQKVGYAPLKMVDFEIKASF